MDELRSAPSASVAPFEAQAVFVRTKSVCASPPDLLTLRWAGEADETETGRLLHLRKEPSCYVSTEAWKTEGGRLVLELCEGFLELARSREARDRGEVAHAADYLEAARLRVEGARELAQRRGDVGLALRLLQRDLERTAA